MRFALVGVSVLFAILSSVALVRFYAIDDPGGVGGVLKMGDGHGVEKEPVLGPDPSVGAFSEREHVETDRANSILLYLQGQVVERGTGHALRARVYCGPTIIYTKADGRFLLGAQHLTDSLRVEASGYESEVVSLHSATGEGFVEDLVVVLGPKDINTSFVYMDGSPASGARVYVMRPGVDRRLHLNQPHIGRVGDQGVCSTVRMGDVVWAENGLMASPVTVVTMPLQQIVLGQKGIPLLWDSAPSSDRLGVPAARFVCKVGTRKVEFEFDERRAPSVIPRIQWRIYSSSHLGYWIDYEASAKDSEVYYDGSRLRLVRPQVVDHLRLVVRRLPNYTVTLVNADTGEPVNHGQAVLEVFSASRPLVRSVRRVAFSTGAEGRIWWCGEFHNLDQFEGRSVVTFRARGFEDLQVDYPARTLSKGGVIRMVQTRVRADLSIHNHDMSPYEGRVMILSESTRATVFEGMCRDGHLGFPFGGESRFIAVVSSGPKGFELDRARSARLVLSATGSVQVSVPGSASEDLVLWSNSAGVIERTEVTAYKESAIVSFDRVPCGAYEVTPRDRCEMLRVNGGDSVPNVQVSPGEVSQVRWEDRWSIQPMVDGVVYGIGSQPEGAQLYVWPYYSESDFVIPSYEILGELFPVGENGGYRLHGMSRTVGGMYVVRRNRLDRRYSIIGYGNDVLSVRLELSSCVVKTRDNVDGYLGILGDVGPLKRDGGAMGGVSMRVDQGGLSYLESVPRSCGVVVLRVRDSSGRWSRVTKTVVNTSEGTLIDFTEVK